MTDIGKVGFSADTKGLVELQHELDVAKEKADRLNESFQKLQASGQNSGQAFNAAKSATAEYQDALAKVIDKQLAAGKAGDALDTIVKNSNLTYGQAAQVLSQATAAHNAYGAAAKTSAAASGEMNEAGRASTGIFSGLANILGLSGGAMTANAGAARAMATEHRAGAEASHALREAMHILEPQLAALGISMQGMTQMSYVARAGMIAFAGTIAGTVVLEMAKSADVIETTRNRLEGLAGVKVGTQLHDGLVDLSSDIGKVAFAMEPALESIVKLKQELANKDPHVIFAAGLDQVRMSAQQAHDVLGTLWEQMRMGGASEAEATAGVNAFFETVRKAGAVTGDAFRQLEKVAPQAAENIARGLTNGFTNGITSVTQLEAQLDKVPASLNAIITVLSRMAGATDEAFDKWKSEPKTVADAVTGLKNSFEELWKAGSGGNDFNSSVTNALKLVKGDMDALTEAIDKNRKGIADDSKMGAFIGGLTSIADTITGAVVPALRSIGDVVMQGVWPGIQSLIDIVTRLIGVFGQMASAAISAASAAASAIAAAAQRGGGAGQAGHTDAMGNPISGNTDGAGNTISDQVGGNLSSSGDAGTIDFGDLGGGTGGITDAFADGGGFTVGGDGGVDTTRVSFMATRGEKVDIYHGPRPGDPASPSAGATFAVGGNGPQETDLLSARFDRTITEQTIALDDAIGAGASKITSAVNNLGSLISNLSLSRGDIVTGGGTTTSSGGGTITDGLRSLGGARGTSPFGGGGSGAGGFNTRNMSSDPNFMGKDAENDAKKNQQQQQKDEQLANQQAQQLARQLASQQSSSRSTAPKRPVKPSDMNQTPNMPALDQNGNPIPGSSRSTNPEPLPGEPGSPAFGPEAPPPGMPGSPFEGPVAPSGLPMTGEPGSSFSGPVAPPNTSPSNPLSETNDKLGDANSTLQDIKDVADQTNSGITDAAEQTTAATDGAASTISDAVSTASASLGDQIGADLAGLGGSLAGALQSLGDGGGGGGGGGGGFGGRSGRSFNGDQNQSRNFPIPNQGGGFGGGEFQPAGPGEPLPGEPGSPYEGPVAPLPGEPGSPFEGPVYPGDLGGGIDSGAGGADLGTNPDFGGLSGVGDIGGGGGAEFATGGQFIVGGDGGQDTTKISFMATRGETVTITPHNDNRIPGHGRKDGIQEGSVVYAGAFETGGSFAVPGSGATDSTPILMHATKGEIVTVETPDQIASKKDTSRAPVTIIVSPGVQADDFIRSRAQIQRGMG